MEVSSHQTFMSSYVCAVTDISNTFVQGELFCLLTAQIQAINICFIIIYLYLYFTSAKWALLELCKSLTTNLQLILKHSVFSAWINIPKVKLSKVLASQFSH